MTVNIGPLARTRLSVVFPLNPQEPQSCILLQWNSVIDAEASP